MKAKQLLELCRKEKREVLILSNKREMLASSFLPGTILPKQVNVQSSPDPDPMGEKMAALQELDDELARQIGKMLRRDLKAHKLIAGMKDSGYRQALTLYYLTYRVDHGVMCLYEWVDVAESMGYSTDYIYKLRSKAMRELHGKTID